MKKFLVISGIVLGSILLLLLAVRIGERCVYASFYQKADKAFAIPGLSDGFVPQGLDYLTEGEKSGSFLSCGYMANGKPSCVYLTDKDGKSTCTVLKNQDGSDYTGHTGGIAHTDDYLFITSSDGLDVFALSDVAEGQASATQIGHILTYNDPAWCYIYDGYLFAGEFYRAESHETPASHRMTTPCGDENTSIVTVFALTSVSDEAHPFSVNPTPVAVLSTPDKVQGFCVTDTGEVAISTSWGFATSHIYLYDAQKLVPDGTFTVNGTDVPLLYLDSSALTRTVKAPPMSEEILCLDGKLYVQNESASNKYVFGKFMSGNHLYRYDLTKD